MLQWWSAQGCINTTEYPKLSAMLLNSPRILFVQAIRLTNSTSAISSTSQNSRPVGKSPVSTDLHPISGYVLCFCKEVVEFETVYQAMLRIAEELHFKTDYLPASTVSLESFMIDGLLSRLQERTKGTVFHMRRNESNILLDGSSDLVDRAVNIFDPSSRAEALESAKIFLFLMNNLDVIASHIRGRLSALQETAQPSGSPVKKTRKSTYRGAITHQVSSADDTPATVLSNQYSSVDSRIQVAVNELCSVISSVLLMCINLDAAKDTAEQRTSKSFNMTQSLLDKQLKTCFGVCGRCMTAAVCTCYLWMMYFFYSYSPSIYCFDFLSGFR